MPRNKIEDLRNHLFEQMERINDDKLKPEQLEKEIKRAKAMANVAGAIIETAKVEVDFLRAIGGDRGTGFIKIEGTGQG